MTMTDNEIVRDYRAAKNKKMQIEILADLNTTTKDEIKKILKANGVDLRGGNYRSKKPAIINKDFDDAINEMIKENKVSFQDLSGYVTKTIPLVMNENTQSEDDVTMEILCKKAVKVNLRIQEANEEGLKEEEDEPKKS